MCPDRDGSFAARLRRRTWTSIAFVGLATLLGTFRLGDKNLWLDEAASASFALGDPRAHWADNNMVLYYALLGGWVKLFGAGEAALRALSVLSFALGAGLFHRLALALIAERAAFAAGLLFVSNAYLVQFAQEARGYSLATTLLIAAALCLCRLLRVDAAHGEAAESSRPARAAAWAWAAAYGATLAAGLYTHLFCAWVGLVFGAVSLRAWRLQPVTRAPLVAAGGLVMLLVAPLLLRGVGDGSAQVSWIRPPTLNSIWGTFILWSGGSSMLAVLECALFAGFLVAPLGWSELRADASRPRCPGEAEQAESRAARGLELRADAGRRRRPGELAQAESSAARGFDQRGGDGSADPDVPAGSRSAALPVRHASPPAEPGEAVTWNRQLVIGWFVAPLLGSVVFSLCVSPIAHPKYLLVALPGWLLGAAAGLECIASGNWRAAVLALALALSVTRLHFWYYDYQKERWREVVRTLAAESRGGDVIVLDLFGSEAFDYYVWRLGVAQRMPELIVPSRAWGFPTPPVSGPDLSAAASARLQAAPRVWFVQNREHRFDASQLKLGAKRPLSTRRYEPQDEDARSLYADSSGRIITLQLFANP